MNQKRDGARRRKRYPRLGRDKKDKKSDKGK